MGFLHATAGLHVSISSSVNLSNFKTVDQTTIQTAQIWKRSHKFQICGQNWPARPFSMSKKPKKKKKTELDEESRLQIPKYFKPANLTKENSMS